MKKNVKIIMFFILFTMIFFFLKTNTLYAITLNSNLPYLNNEELSLKISNLNSFGKHKIEKNKKFVYTNFTSDFELTDSRSKSFGYNLTVEATPFRIVEPSTGWVQENNYSLPIGSLILNPIQSIESLNQAETFPRLYNSFIILDINQAVNVLTADKGIGVGKYRIGFGENALGLVIDPTTAKIDKINYPNSPTVYESTITWNLITSVNMDDLIEPVEPGNEPENINDFIYIVQEGADNNNQDGTIKILGYNGSKEHLIIPSKINGKDVVEINENAFYPKMASQDRGKSKSKLKSVIIPNTVTKIGNYAFYANQLTELTIPDSVTHIGEGAFYNNAIRSVKLSSNLKEISDSAFQSNQLRSIVIPDSVNSIGYLSFSSNQLESVHLGSGLKLIGQEAFTGNPFSSITIPSNVLFIGQKVFYYNYNLRTITDKSNIITNSNKGNYSTSNPTIKRN